MSFQRRKLKEMVSFFVICFFLLEVVAIPPLYAFHTGAGDMHGGTSVGETAPDPEKGQEEPGNDAKNNPGEAGDPVSLENGEFVYTKDDLLIPARGLNIHISHSYRNRRNFNGRWGYGWFFNYDIKLKKLENNNLLLLDGTGRKDEFIYNGPDADYTPPSGLYEIIQENEDGTYTRILRHGQKYHFNINGSLTKIEDRNGNSLTFDYDPAGKLPVTGKSAFFVSQTEGIVASDYKLTKITDPVGREITLSYNEKGRLSNVADWTGRTIKYGYDENDNLISITSPATADYPEGLTTTFSYFDNHNLKSIIDPKDQEYLTQTYDDQNRISSQIYGSGTYTFTYDDENSKVTVVDRMGYKTDYFLNDNGNITQKIVFTAEPKLRATDPGSYTTNYEYNSNMEISRVTYPRGNSIEYTYDQTNADPRARGNLLELRRKPLPGSTGEADIVTAFTYESRCNLTKTITDPRGNVTTYTYDYEDEAFGTETGNLMKITYPSVGVQIVEANFTYDTYGQKETLADPNGNVTKYEYYPSTGYLWKEIDGYGIFNNTTEMTYDSVGNISSVKNPRGNTIGFTYNNLNQLTQTTAPAPFSYITKYQYDRNGNLKQVDRQSGDAGNPWITTFYTYNSLDKLKTITDELENVTTFGYDNNENRISITDAEANITSYDYDERDLLWKVTDSEAHVTEYAYDLNANLKTIKDAKYNETNYDHDDFDRLKTTTYADSSTESFEYDASSNLTKKINWNSQAIDYAYDNLNRLDSKTYPDNSIVDYAYDAASRLTSVSDSNGTIIYSYDEVNRIKNATYPGGKVVAYEYDSAGNKTKLTYPDGDHITYVYDELNRLDQVKNATSQIIADYTYDNLGRRTQVDYLNGSRATYIYDETSRLVSLDNKVINPESLISGFNYGYDNVGNRKYVIYAHDSQKGDVYTYDNIYQLTNVKYNVIEPVAESQNPGFSTFDFQNSYTLDSVGNRISMVNGSATTYTSNNMNQYTSVGGFAYSYDNNGNLINNGPNSYLYDYENRLTQATTPIDTITYKYDAFGRRIEKNTSGLVVKFIYDANQAIIETDNNGNTEAKYVYGTGIDEILTMKRGLNTYFYHFDGLGNVATITNSINTIVESYDYDVYGKSSIKDGTGIPLSESAIESTIMFAGRRFDKECELYYNRGRYYDENIGRFLQTDPIGYVGGFNLYAYVANNPTNFTDPLGLSKSDGMPIDEAAKRILDTIGQGDIADFVDKATKELGKLLSDPSHMTSGEDLQDIAKSGLKALPLSDKLHLPEIGEAVDILSKILPKMYYDNRLRKQQEADRRVLEERIKYNNEIERGKRWLESLRYTDPGLYHELTGTRAKKIDIQIGPWP